MIVNHQHEIFFVVKLPEHSKAWRLKCIKPAKLCKGSGCHSGPLAAWFASWRRWLQELWNISSICFCGSQCHARQKCYPSASKCIRTRTAQWLCKFPGWSSCRRHSNANLNHLKGIVKSQKELFLLPPLTDVTVTTHKTGEISNSFPRGRNNFIEVSKWQRNVVFEAISVNIDQTVSNLFSDRPNVSHFARLVGWHAVNDQIRFHGFLKEIVELFLIVVLIAAWSLD